MAEKVVMTIYSPEVSLEEDIVTSTGAQLLKSICKNEDEIIAQARDADAVIAGATIQPFTEKVIDNLAKCRIIANLGIGYDKLDVAAATRRGICVTNCPDYCLDEVSNHTMMMMLALSRKLIVGMHLAMEGKWLSNENRKLLMPIHRVRGQTVGIIGLGRIGRALVPKAKGFGLKVIAYSPSAPTEVFRDLGVERVDIDTLLETSDFVSLHAPHNEANRHMIGQEQLRKMKPTAFLINTARGQLVDEEALTVALRERQIAGAGLDVMSMEPPDPENPLFRMDNVIVTGHSGGLSVESEAEVWRRPFEEVARVLRGQWPVGLLNPEVKERFEAKWGPMK